MARIAGVNIPTNKRVVIALQYIHGIGAKKAEEICAKASVPAERRVNQLTDQEVLVIRETIDRDYVVEGDLRREVSMNIKRLMDLGVYRGLRHRRNLPVRGQRTHTNARTPQGQGEADRRQEEVTRSREQRAAPVTGRRFSRAPGITGAPEGQIETWPRIPPACAGANARTSFRALRM